SGGSTGTGNLILNNNSSTAGGITVSGAGTLNNIGTVINNSTGSGTVTFSAPIGSSVKGITQNSPTAMTASGAVTVGAAGFTLATTSVGTALTVSGAVTGTGN